MITVSPQPPNLEHYRRGLPDWLCHELERYQHVMQIHWRPARIRDQTRRFWSGHTRLWHWLLEHYPIKEIKDVKRQYVLEFVDYQLSAGYAVTSINADLRYFHAFLLFLQDGDHTIPQALFHVPSLKKPDSLPKFLTDEQVRQLRDEFERCAEQILPAPQKRDALLDRAAFYLLWQAGLRLGEVEELELDDLDLPNRKLMVRQGKGMKDRTVFLTDTTVQSLKHYLAVRGMGPDNHVFLYRNQPVNKDLIRSRIKYAGERVGVKVHPHRLRHTCATQLLNAGCRVTSIQKFLGHRRLNSTMTYARVHDKTVATDYYRAMAEVEKNLTLTVESDETKGTLTTDERTRLMELAKQLAEPTLSTEIRLNRHFT